MPTQGRRHFPSGSVFVLGLRCHTLWSYRGHLKFKGSTVSAGEEVSQASTHFPPTRESPTPALVISHYPSTRSPPTPLPTWKSPLLLSTQLRAAYSSEVRYKPHLLSEVSVAHLSDLSFQHSHCRGQRVFGLCRSWRHLREGGVEWTANSASSNGLPTLSSRRRGSARCHMPSKGRCKWQTHDKYFLVQSCVHNITNSISCLRLSWPEDIRTDTGAALQAVTLRELRQLEKPLWGRMLPSLGAGRPAGGDPGGAAPRGGQRAGRKGARAAQARPRHAQPPLQSRSCDHELKIPGACGRRSAVRTRGGRGGTRSGGGGSGASSAGVSTVLPARVVTVRKDGFSRRYRESPCPRAG